MYAAILQYYRDSFTALSTVKIGRSFVIIYQCFAGGRTGRLWETASTAKLP